MRMAFEVRVESLTLRSEKAADWPTDRSHWPTSNIRILCTATTTVRTVRRLLWNRLAGTNVVCVEIVPARNFCLIWKGEFGIMKVGTLWVSFLKTPDWRRKETFYLCLYFIFSIICAVHVLHLKMYYFHNEASLIPLFFTWEVLFLPN